MKIFFVSVMIALSLSVNAQITDDFETNKMGWTEYSGKEGEVVIADGVMRMEGKKDAVSLWGFTTEPSFILTSCYAPIDVTKDFEFSVDASARGMSDNNYIGIILDYIDGGNYIAFTVGKEGVALVRYHEYRLIGRKMAEIKKIKRSNAKNLNFKVKSSYQKMEFYVNDMKALEVRYLPLTSNGIGLYVYGKQKVQFDNMSIIQ